MDTSTNNAIDRHAGEKAMPDLLIRQCSPREAAARACLTAYYAELARRFACGFDPRISPVADDELTPPRGVLLVADPPRRPPAGCGALIMHPGSIAVIKRIWVAPELRRHGVGRRILTELEKRARDFGASRIRLETRTELTAAISMYRRLGFDDVRPFSSEPYADHWFEKAL